MNVPFSAPFSAPEAQFLEEADDAAGWVAGSVVLLVSAKISM
jgi:hypothetical protein